MTRISSLRRYSRVLHRLLRGYRARTRLLIKKVSVQIFFLLLVRIRWLGDARQLPLNQKLWPLYKNIHLHAKAMNSRFPRLVSPTTYRDYLSWLMLFDQNPDKIICSDKIAVRDWVRLRIGEKYLIPLVGTFERVEFEKLRAQKRPFVAKLNNDSGSMRAFLPSATREEIDRKLEQLDKLQGRLYGWEKGEWPYRFIAPAVIIEEFVGDSEAFSFPTEYKFHCVEGKISWVQVIRMRDSEPCELLLDSEGNRYPFTFARKNQLDRWRPKPKQWDEMENVARVLSADFKYVRVDLLLSGEKVFFGEMTFFPLAGFPQEEANQFFGDYMSFDRTALLGRTPLFSY